MHGNQVAGLSASFFRYLPWINLSGILTIALDIWMLRQGYLGVLTRWMHIGLEFVGIAIATAMLRGPSLLTFFPGNDRPGSRESAHRHLRHNGPGRPDHRDRSQHDRNRERHSAHVAPR